MRQHARGNPSQGGRCESSLRNNPRCTACIWGSCGFRGMESTILLAYNHTAALRSTKRGACQCSIRTIGEFEFSSHGRYERRGDRHDVTLGPRIFYRSAFCGGARLFRNCIRCGGDREDSVLYLSGSLSCFTGRPPAASSLRRQKETLFPGC